MADDRAEVIGKWTVKFKDWIWQYTFSGDGSVAWLDPLNNLGGSGRWTKAGQLVHISWIRSSTKESWNCPIRPVAQTGWVSASYGSGPLKAQKLAATTAPATSGSAIPNDSWVRYVDFFSNCYYDVNYKIPADQSFAFSSILRLTYLDGVEIELDIEKDFSTQELTSDMARDAIARATIGRSGRIFPSVLVRQTTPRLWAARADAFRAWDEAANDFESLALTGMSFALMVPAMPVGAMVEETATASTALRVTRRTVPGGVVRPPPTGWPQGVDFKTVQQVLEGRAPSSQMSREQAGRAAAYYRQMAGQVKGTRAADAKAFNLERARFLEEGGDVPPGKLNDFVKRTRQ